ncbi:tigger transposable element-derived protein 2 [Biomphalaria glabrata]
MVSVNFEEWFLTIAVPWARRKQGRKIVIGDNLSSHISHLVLKKCEEHNIGFILIPPNSTDKCQFLDVSFFAPLKKEWRRLLECHEVKHPSSTSLDKKMFPAMLGSLIDGIAGTERSNTRKKIHVPPGKSISVEELDASSDTRRQQSTPSVEPVTQVVVPVDEIQSTSTGTGIDSSHASSEEIITDSDDEWLPPRQKNVIQALKKVFSI